MAPSRRPAPRHVRVRYGRMTAAGTAFVVTLVALLAGVGIIPAQGSTGAYAGSSRVLTSGSIAPAATPTPRPTPAPAATPTPTPSSTPSPASSSASPGTGAQDVALPEGSGSGTRVVFDISDQRVWLVRHQGGGDGEDGEDTVLRTYLVSGSVTDNLDPGTYAVYSRSRYATGIDDSGTMQYFVRFTRGANAAIGFHDIPVKDGALVESRAQLGSPQSHGCIRQYRPDAIALWDFAPVGRSVVVTA